MSSHETLGLLLVRDGLITRPQLYDALRLQRQNHRLLGTCLLSLGYIDAEHLLEILSRQLAVPPLLPGALAGASPEAVARVPGDLAVRLRILPYSWDGDMIGVAVTDGRALNHLHEVAFHARSAVGAYVALEVEVEAALRQYYPDAAAGLRAAPPSPADGRPRPARVGPLTEVPSRDFGAALGLEEPVLLERRKDPAPAPAPVPHPAPENNVIQAPPPRAPVQPPPAPGRPEPEAPERLELGRVPFYDAVEKIYEAESPAQVGQHTGRALLNYFNRVLVLRAGGDRLDVVGFGGVETPPATSDLGQVPTVRAHLATRNIAYGPAGEDPRAAELVAAFGIGPAPTSLIAPIADALVVYADNGAIDELYEDLHDVEMLFKEAETALGMLDDAPKNTFPDR